MEGEGVMGGENVEAGVEEEGIADESEGGGVEAEGGDVEGIEGATVLDNIGEIEGKVVDEIRGEYVDTESGSIDDIPTDTFTEGKNNLLVGDKVEEEVNTSDPKSLSMNADELVMLELLLNSE